MFKVIKKLGKNLNDAIILSILSKHTKIDRQIQKLSIFSRIFVNSVQKKSKKKHIQKEIIFYNETFKFSHIAHSFHSFKADCLT